jgi:4-hydroxy-tetrahydrodipicolinate reductase
MIKIALFGTSGRMGQATLSLARSESDLSIVKLTEEFDLLIDFSLAAAFPIPLVAARKAKKPIVIGVTGYTEREMEEIQALSLDIPVFYSPNFSLGMALFRELTKRAADQFSPHATLDLFESHHAKKKDIPSGSALLIAKEMEALGKSLRIHSIRSGSLIGEHSLFLNSDEESLEISHTVHTRDAFAKGALAAARFLVLQKPGLYGMHDLFV